MAASPMHVERVLQACDSVPCQQWEMHCMKMPYKCKYKYKHRLPLLASDKMLIQMRHKDLKAEK